MRGFVRAGAASDAAYDNARAFLVAQASDSWNPDGRSSCSPMRSPSATLLDPATVRIVARAAGTDADGRYTAARPGSTVTATFRLQTVSGEWRISGLPEGFGRWIPSSDVSRLVQPYAVHYVATSRRGLVPDVRWFLADRLATGSPGRSSWPCRATSRGPPSRPCRPVRDCSARPCRSSRASRRSTSSRTSSVRGSRTGRTCGRSSSAPCSRTARCRGSPCRSTAYLSTSRDSMTLELGGVALEIGFPPTSVAALARPVVRRGSDVAVFDPAALGEQEHAPTRREPELPPVGQDFQRLALSADGAELAGIDPGGDGMSRWRE